jgi:hypothetical protein
MAQFLYLAFAAIAAVLPLPTVEASYVIADSRVQNMAITPVLGRGYSIMTDTYQSTCLLVEETTVPSYNYDCKYSNVAKIYTT